MFSVYENIVYRFSLGEDNHIRESAGDYAHPIRSHFYAKYNSNAKKRDRYLRYINAKSFSISLKLLSLGRQMELAIIDYGLIILLSFRVFLTVLKLSALIKN